jgi:hypothetical protein
VLARCSATSPAGAGHTVSADFLVRGDSIAEAVPRETECPVENCSRARNEKTPGKMAESGRLSSNAVPLATSLLPFRHKRCCHSPQFVAKRQQQSDASFTKEPRTEPRCVSTGVVSGWIANSPSTAYYARRRTARLRARLFGRSTLTSIANSTNRYAAATARRRSIIRRTSNTTPTIIAITPYNGKMLSSQLRKPMRISSSANAIVPVACRTGNCRAMR